MTEGISGKNLKSLYFFICVWVVLAGVLRDVAAGEWASSQKQCNFVFYGKAFCNGFPVLPELLFGVHH